MGPAFTTSSIASTGVPSPSTIILISCSFISYIIFDFILPARFNTATSKLRKQFQLVVTSVAGTCPHCFLVCPYVRQFRQARHPLYSPLRILEYRRTVHVPELFHIFNIDRRVSYDQDWLDFVQRSSILPLRQRLAIFHLGTPFFSYAINFNVLVEAVDDELF